MKHIDPCVVIFAEVTEMMKTGTAMELRGLQGQIEEISLELEREGELLDQLRRLRLEKTRRGLERSARRMRGKRNGRGGRARGKEEDLDLRISHLVGELERLSALREKREVLVRQRREVMRDRGIRSQLGGNLAKEVSLREERQSGLKIFLGKLEEAGKLLRQADRVYGEVLGHVDRAKKASYVDIFLGGLGGLVAKLWKRKAMKRARDTGGRGRRLIARANKLLREIDLRTVYGRMSVPELDGYLDFACDFDWIAHGQISETARSLGRMRRHLRRNLNGLKDARREFESEIRRLRMEIEDLHIHAEGRAVEAFSA